MTTTADIRRADEIVRQAIDQADALVTLDDPQGRAAARRLLTILAQADRSLENRLRAWNRDHGGGEMRATQATLMAYREQTLLQLAVVRGRLRGLTTDSALRAAGLSADRSVKLLSDLERAFRGIALPTRVNEAMLSALQPSLLRSHATSVDRYGRSMIGAIERELSQAFAEGVSQRDMVDRLVALRGPAGTVSIRAVEIQPGMVVRLAEEEIPEGLFVRHRSWAWRVVRTETANAQNAASLGQMKAQAEELPDVQKKIVAVLDQRTAWDSIAVHGQVRPIDDLFRDGAGREYERPPSRPHDRETIIPWRARWPETEHSRPLTVAERDAMWARNEKWQQERQRKRGAARRREAARA